MVLSLISGQMPKRSHILMFALWGCLLNVFVFVIVFVFIFVFFFVIGLVFSFTLIKYLMRSHSKAVLGQTKITTKFYSGRSPLPDRQSSLSPRSHVIGGTLNRDSYKNGGVWLMSVHNVGHSLVSWNWHWLHRLLQVGFTHLEDHYWKNGRRRGPEAYKSVGLGREPGSRYICNFW